MGGNGSRYAHGLEIPLTDASPARGRFGTFTGVFTPTLLTILGVILYVRTGWVVGNAGLGGALLIVVLALTITSCTALSLSSIATNTRIGPGGPFAIFTRSLGLEVAGSIGIPLYLTRPLGVAMYIFGFREGMLWLLPALPPMAVDLGLFGVLFAIAFIGADLAFKTQYFIMGVIALSLVSIFASPVAWEAPASITWWGEYPGSPGPDAESTHFWGVFAVFFPATTGVLTGANMSGELKDPRRSIPVGTLAAVGLASLVYLSVVVWSTRVATAETLVSNTSVLIDTAWMPGLVVAGLLGATASSALAGLVDGPRILQALAANEVVPGSKPLAALRDGEPRTAMVVTGVLTLGAIMLRDLNAIAPLLTMFFLLTYASINLVVLLEVSLGLTSYRPTLRLPVVVPLVGLVGSVFSMFIVNPSFSLVAVVIVGVLYFSIRRRGHRQDQANDGARSSIFVAVAEWAASRVLPEDLDNVRAWRPHVLVPVADMTAIRDHIDLLLDLTRPEGSVQLLGLGEHPSVELLRSPLEDMARSFRSSGVRASSAVVELPDFSQAIRVCTMALQGVFFRPNLLLLRQPGPVLSRVQLESILHSAVSLRMGVLLLCPHPHVVAARPQNIRLWVRRGTQDWDAQAAFDSGNLNLILLMGFRLWREWRGALTLITVVEDTGDVANAQRFLDGLCDLARLTDRAEREVRVGRFETCVQGESAVALTIMGLQRTAPDLAWTRRMVELTRGTCLFVLDSGKESALA